MGRKQHHKKNNIEEFTYKKDFDRGVKVVVNCNGSNIGNGVGIGNGNLNGGGGGNGDGGGSGYTGYTGYTGNTGDTGGQVCDTICNVVCEQIYLEQFANPENVSTVGDDIIWTIKATNVSKSISRPLVISSSFFGTKILSLRGIDMGETIKYTVNSVLTANDLDQSIISSVAFIAYGIADDEILGGYKIGERISPVLVTKATIDKPAI